MTKVRDFRIMLALVALCAASRLVFLSSYWPEDYRVLPVDVDGYWQIAANLREGRGFAEGPGASATASRPPAYPFFLAAVHWLTGGRDRLALASQAAVDAATCIAIYFLAMVVMGSSGAAHLACLLWAAYLPEGSHVTRFWSEPLGALLFTSALLFFVLGLRWDADWLHGVAGLLLAGTALTRPAFVLFPLFLAPLLLMKQGEKLGRRLSRVGILLLGFILPMTVWAIRNAVVFHAFVPVTTHGGFTFFTGNSMLDEQTYLNDVGPLFSYGIRKFRSIVGEAEWSRVQGSVVELDGLYRREALRLIREHPARFAKLTLVRLPRLWFNLGSDRKPSWRTWSLAGINSALLVLGFIGMMAARGTWLSNATPLVMGLVYGTLVHLPIIGLPRYVFPVIPLLVVLAAGGVRAVCGAARRQGHPG